MPNRPWTIASLCGSMVLLGGCAIIQPQRAPEPPPVSSAQFESGLIHLQSLLAERCDAQVQALAEQRDAQQGLTADVREVGSLLRGLKSDLATALEAEAPAQPAVSQCQIHDDSLGNKELLGRNEWVDLPSVGTYLAAEISSSASTSALAATEITNFERDGETWVRFKLDLTADDESVASIRDDWVEAPVVRQQSDSSRPVIRLLMNLGPLREQVEFTLTERRRLASPIRLGRRFLMDIAIIDVAEEFLHDRPEFPEKSPGPEASSAEE